MAPKLRKRARLRKVAKFVRHFGKRGRKYSVFLERKGAEALVGKETINAMRRVPKQKTFGKNWITTGAPQPGYNPYFMMRWSFQKSTDGKAGFSVDFSLKPIEPNQIDKGFHIDVSIKSNRDLISDSIRSQEAKDVAEEVLASLEFPAGTKVVKNLDIRIE